MPAIRNFLTGRYIKQNNYKRKCIICGVLFINPQMKVLTCSRACGYEKIKSKPKAVLPRKCVICKKEFTIPKAWVAKKRGNEGVYCSRECRYKVRMRWTANEKQNARTLIRSLIHRGILEVKLCETCNKSAQAHHYKGYDRKNWLDIKWLCPNHHLQEHERLRRTGLIGLT